VTIRPVRCGVLELSGCLDSVSLMGTLQGAVGRFALPRRTASATSSMPMFREASTVGST
jgi:hypothetical protein